MTKRINLSNLSESFSELTSMEKEEMMERVKKAIKRKKSDVLTSMMNAVENHVASYKQDFYIYDVELFHKHDVSFIWMVRESGTQWLNLENDHMVSEKISLNENDFEYHVKYSRIIAYYYYNKQTKTFSKINEQKARTLIQQQYQQMTA